VTVNETYPANVVFDSAQPSPLSGTNNTFVLGNLTPGAVVVINITVNVSSGATGTLTNTVIATFQNTTGTVLNATDSEDTTIATAPAPAAGGGSGGGWTTPTVGGVELERPRPVCVESWACEGWSGCVGGVQSRDCADLRACNTTYAQPALERACVPEVVPQGEQPLVLLQPLEPFIALFRANLWIIVFTILGIVFLTMASWQVGQHRGDLHYRPPQVPLPRLPEHGHAQRSAGRPREKKHFYKALDRLDRQLAELDKGKLPARLKERLKPAELPRAKAAETPRAVPQPTKPASQRAALPVHETPRRPGLLQRLSERISRKVERLDRERTRELSEPRARALPVPKPVVLKPLKLPSRAQITDKKQFYNELDALDRQIGGLDRKHPAAKAVKPLRVGRELPVQKPAAPKRLPASVKLALPPVPVVPVPAKPARARPDAFDRKLREAMRTKIDPLPQKKTIAPRPVVPKGPSLYDRIAKRIQKITAAPEPRVPASKPVSKVAEPKQVRLPSLQDIKRKALTARVKKPEDREDFRKKLRSFDDELEKLDKKMKKKAK
jgi:hypothetical protein